MHALEAEIPYLIAYKIHHVKKIIEYMIYRLMFSFESVASDEWPLNEASSDFAHRNMLLHHKNNFCEVETCNR